MTKNSCFWDEGEGFREKFILKYLIISFLKLFARLRYSWEGGPFFCPENSLILADLQSELDPLWVLILWPEAKVYLSQQKKGAKKLFLFYAFLGVEFFEKEPLFPEREEKEFGKKVLFLRRELKKGGMEPFQEDLAFSSLHKAEKAFLFTVRGMLGSCFSSPFFSGQKKVGVTFSQIGRLLVKNALFFLPRRKLHFSLKEAPEQIFEKQKGRSLSTFLDTLFFSSEKPQKVSYFFYKKAYLIEEETSHFIKKKVYRKIAKLTRVSRGRMKGKDHLVFDLHLSSLEITEILVFLEEHFDQRIEFEDIKTVEDVVQAALGRFSPIKEETVSTKIWEEDSFRQPLYEGKEETLLEAFLQNGQREGRALCVADSSSCMSYDRVKSLVIGLALVLQEIEEERVGLFLTGTICSLVVFALLLLQKVPVMLNPTLGKTPLEEMIKIASCKTLITSKKGSKNLPFSLEELGPKLVFLEEKQEMLSLEQRKKALSLGKGSIRKLLSHFSWKRSQQDPVVMLFTSGSEGKAKAVVLSSSNLLQNQKAAIKRIHFTEKEVLLALLPAFHVFGFSISQLLPFLFGCRVVFCSNPLDLTTALFLIQKWKVTILCTSPTLLEGLFSMANTTSLQSVKKAVIGAEKPQESLFAKAKAFPWIEIIEGYGLTECSPIVSLQEPFSEKQGVGKPLDNLEVEIIHPETKNFLLPEEEGIISVSGPNVFSGYEKEEKASFFEKEGKIWFQTTDRGYKNSKGTLFITGRTSRFIQKAGEGISLDRIEQTLSACFFPVELAVVEEGKKLVLVTSKELALSLVNETLQKKGFSPLFFLDKTVVLPKLPRFVTGKINYGQIKKTLKQL